MYDSIELKRLRNEIQLLRDELALMKRKYEDIIYNLDTDNFSSRFTKEQGDMRAAIEFTAEGIKSKVSKDDLDAYSTKIQTAEQIQNIVYKGANLDEAITITALSQATDTSKIYVIKEIRYPVITTIASLWLCRLFFQKSEALSKVRRR